MYVLGCRLSLFRLCGSDFGITAVDGITNGITWAVFCFHMPHISFASSWYLFCLSVIVLARLCVFGTAMAIKKALFFFVLLLLLLLLLWKIKYEPIYNNSEIMTGFIMYWKVAGSIPDGVIGFFHWHNPSGRTRALGSTQPLTEMSTRNISWG